MRLRNINAFFKHRQCVTTKDQKKKNVMLCFVKKSLKQIKVTTNKHV